jgi:hypothetical protein
MILKTHFFFSLIHLIDKQDKNDDKIEIKLV